MGYQQPKVPRFYIDMMSYIHAVGHGEYFVRNEGYHGNNTEQKIYFGDMADLLYCNNQSLLKFNSISGGFAPWQWTDGVTSNYFPVLPINFAMIFNHNFEGMKPVLHFKDGGTHRFEVEDFQDTIINFGTGNNCTIEHNGWSLRRSDTTNLTQDVNTLVFWLTSNNFTGNVGNRYMGSTILGHTWDPPASMNTVIGMEREFGGIKSNKTAGGYDHVTVDYVGNPLWSGHNAWELWDYPEDPTTTPPNESPNDTTQPMFVEDKRSRMGSLGRRVWRLKISYLHESDLFPALEQTNIYPYNTTDTYPEGSETFQASGLMDNPALLEDNFISRVWTPSLGGAIPFVFQPDRDNNNPDQFAICKINRQTLSIRPKAPNVYDLTFDVEEVW